MQLQTQAATAAKKGGDWNGSCIENHIHPILNVTRARVSHSLHVDLVQTRERFRTAAEAFWRAGGSKMTEAVTLHLRSMSAKLGTLYLE